MTAYREKSSVFRADKANFFKSHVSIPLGDSELFLTGEDGVKIDESAVHDYGFLLKNKALIETEFEQLFRSLKNKKDKEAFWLYGYYCAAMLENFYKAYGQPSKAKEYAEYRVKIKHYRSPLSSQEEKNTSVVDTVYNAILKGFKNICSAPWHTTKIKDYVAYANLNRLYLTFCRLTLTAGLSLAEVREFIAKIDALLGTHTDINKAIARLQAPAKVMNYLSVGFFLARFIIDAGLLVRHTFFPSEEEKGSALYERFKFELSKRHFNFANDLVWTTVNTLSNFNYLFGISGAAAGYLTLTFLFFDMAMILYKKHCAEEDYQTKKAQYIEEISYYEDEAQQIEQLHAQLQKLEIKWQNTKATYNFYATAAGLLIIGFSAAMIINLPLTTVGGFFICLGAVAMYLSGDAYAHYNEKSLALKETQLLTDSPILALKEYQLARNDFMCTLAKNTFLPMVAITLFATCLPAALLFTALVIGYELYEAASLRKSEEPPPEPTLCMAAV